MSEPAPSFSVEVTGFPSDSDPDVVAASFAEVFGISIEDGQRLVRKVPVRVKRNASSEMTRQLVRQLRQLGAEVRVRNEQTHEERTFRSDDGSISQLVPVTHPAAAEPARRPPPDEAPPEDTLESEDANAPPESPPRVEIVTPATIPAAAPAEEPADLPVASSRSIPRPPRMPGSSPSGRLRTPQSVPFGEVRSMSSSQPGEPRVTVASSPGEARTSAPSHPGEGRVPISSQTGEQGAPRAPMGVSIPPPSQPLVASIPPPSRTALQACASCKSPVEKGDTCSRCGWSNADKLRRCRTCKKKLVLCSNISKSPMLVAAVAAGAIAMGAAGLLIFGALAGVAGLALGVCLGFVGDSLTLRYACETCTVAVVSERLQTEEQTRLSAARRRSAAIAIGCGAAALAFGALPAGSSKTLAATSFGMAWSVQVPSGHGRIDGEVAMLQVPPGVKRARVQWAEKSFLKGKTYFLATLQYTHPEGPAEPDKAGLQATIKQLVEVEFTGTLAGPPVADGESFRADFQGTFHGKPVFGRIRGTQYDHDMVLVAVTAPAAAELQDAGVDAFFASVAVERAVK